MNTGIMDAHNLGWKLALVVSGRAPDALLDSYGTERLPVAEDVLRLTHTLVRYGSMSHPVKRRVRDVVGDHGAGPILLVRPDGHLAARGMPGVTGYLRDLFGETGTASFAGGRPASGTPRAAITRR